MGKYRFWGNKSNSIIQYDSTDINVQQQTMLPTLINKNEPQFLSVEEIGDKLKSDRDIRNIALTGPYGSGKSSVLFTLRKHYPDFHYLQISLATLESYDNSEEDKKQKEEVEKLNRLIEYSILQQLIYREKYKDLPNSRFRRILHITKPKLLKWTSGIVGFFIAYIIAFEPNWLRVDTVCEFFDWGVATNTVFDIISILYMIAGLFICVWELLSTYYGYKLNKFNLKDGEVELQEETSIFNKHLDEIIYFFQVTNYDVLIIEDLDRFDTSDIYLKLRELNQLINDSKEIGRHITFIYAVKDDVFRDSQRSKFFDYISTVIPIINLSNSKDKLKEELRVRGYKDIRDDDLEEIAFFINDMRLLRNIANEYQQYRKRLCAVGKISLNPTKLLAMIVYKNYFPRDFALLHNREGKVYQCISSKSKFVAYAQRTLEERKKALKEQKRTYTENTHLSKTDLRNIIAYRIVKEMHTYPKTILIDDGNRVGLQSVIDDETLFENLLSSRYIDYTHESFRYQSVRSDLNISESIYKSYWERKKAIEDLPEEIIREEKDLASEERRIKSLKLAQLFAVYNMTQCEDFTRIELEPLMNVFLRRGYIDEEYYDYISYFYPDMVSQNDRDLLLAMKQTIKGDYQAHIDKIENFAKKTPLYVFNDDCILNNGLADFLISSQKPLFQDKYELFMKRIERIDAPFDFMIQYYQNSEYAKTLFRRFIEWNVTESWTAILGYSDVFGRIVLIEAWLRFCEPSKLLEKQRNWLNEKFDFLTEHLENIGLEQTRLLSKQQQYIALNTNSHKLLDFVIANNLYSLNKENLCIITNYLNKSDKVNTGNLNLSRIKGTSNNVFISYVETNLDCCLKLFSDTINDEEADSLLLILNNEHIVEEDKIGYLINQQNRIEDVDDVMASFKDMAVKLLLIRPTWENVASYFSCSNRGDLVMLKPYIEHYGVELGGMKCDDLIEVKGELFEFLLASNLINIDTFKMLSNSFDNTIDNADSIINLESERIDFLIDEGKVEYTNGNTSRLFSHKAPIIAKYLISYKDCFLHEIKTFNYTAELAICLLKSNAFTLDEKSQIISVLTLDIIKDNSNLATEICSHLTKVRINLNADFLKTVLLLSHNIRDQVSVVTYAIEKNGNNASFIESLLSQLPSPYADIAKHDQKHPILENTDHNLNLLDVLRKNSYISSVSVTGKGLKINKKMW
ncbi:hypothetical protein [Bacteroides reticulotermitis]|uniref:YobI family P-loop NTPase n=1 Tax=Bacteroides reticulotermitis TaxID=1133319 RepID=UPI003A87B9B5